MKSHNTAVREILKACPDGFTVNQIVGLMGEKANSQTIRACLKSMPDTYIDRWVRASRGQYESVWCVVVPPPNCPHPTQPTKGQRRRSK